MKKANSELRKNFETTNKVIVFPAESLLPWDNVARFNFLECNMKDVVDGGIPYQKDKLKFKTSFVGQIN